MGKQTKFAGVNPRYQTKEMLSAIAQAYKNNVGIPLVALGEFFTKEQFRIIQKELQAGWKQQEIPDQESFDIGPKSASAKAIAAFGKQISGKQPLTHIPRRFKHRDFTLMHDEKPEPAGVLAILFLDDWNAEWGGEFVVYAKGEALARFTPQTNTLLIVERKKGMHSFFRYVNHHAKKNTFRVLSA